MSKTNSLFAFLIVFVFVSAVAAPAQTAAPSKGNSALTQAFEFFGDGSYLGVQTQEVTKENFSKFGLSNVRGVAIEKVLDDSPAKQAGLQDGDVIVRFNGEEVSSYRKLTRLISETAPDHQAKLTVVRGGSEREITVTMGKRPTPKFELGNFEMVVPEQMGKVFSQAIPTMPGFRIDKDGKSGDIFIWEGGKDGSVFFGSTKQIGVGVSSLTKQLGDYFGVADGKGLLVNSVNENSPAAKAGLKAGDVITEVEGKAVNNIADLIRGLNEKKEGEVSLTIVRNRNRQTVKITPEKMQEGEIPWRITTQPGGQIRMNSAPKVMFRVSD